ncbi:hypothetical protein [Gordonia sp. (in: high G+C Gram-positive bacteria)]|uniref:hypothetical protein n=1 Tax=Gordonia sp. (in: high G+C Gram-positive bacteria) TaxID=84139 RepID=UPI0039E42821
MTITTDHTPVPAPPRPYPYPPVPAPRRPMGAARIADLVATVVLSLIGLTAALLAAYLTLFFAMATDGCSATNCRTDLVGWAYLVSWGGAGLGVAVILAGVIASAVRRRVMFLWPLLGTALTVGGFLLGVSLASNVVS